MFSEVMAEYSKEKLEEYYICYFDILGYRAFFEDDSREDNKFLFSIISADGIFRSAIKNAKADFEIGHKMYSDNFILYFKKTLTDDVNALRVLTRIIREIQIRFLMDEGLLLRGGITAGEFYANDDFVFGKGLIRAVELEERVAKEPRVVIDKEHFEKSLSIIKSDGYVTHDFDDEYFVNYFDGKALLLIKGKCIRLINTHCKYKYNVKDPNKIAETEKTIRKYIWLLTQFNLACKHNACENLAIEYEIKINERLCKTEIYAKQLGKQTNE